METRNSSLIRLPEVKRRTGLSRSEVYRRVKGKGGRFPQPITLGAKCIAWDDREINDWIVAQIAERDRAGAA